MRIAPLSLLLLGLGLASLGTTACRSSNEARPDPAPPSSAAPQRAPLPPSEQGAPTQAPSASAAPSAAAPTASASAASPSASGARTGAPAGSGASALAPGHGRDGGAAGRAECTSDSDCRAWSDTCGDCTCRPLAKGVTAPKCTRNQVQCFVDPCRNKRGVCKAGACALNDDGAM
ncbi:hypothetical protein LZC95_18960 [Pendulispora brunnea]|uniref:Uncharacterized protein n=1 Tax=Pendulispora brunnea TaxID=2905690 RepID=A0ABZ2KPG3_9BACT